MMAHISDNLTRTRFGRRIPYMMLCPLYSIAFFILVSPPDCDDCVNDNGDLIKTNGPAVFWFGCSYIVFYLCDTVINVPFQALGIVFIFIFLFLWLTPCSTKSNIKIKNAK